MFILIVMIPAGCRSVRRKGIDQSRIQPSFSRPPIHERQTYPGLYAVQARRWLKINLNLAWISPRWRHECPLFSPKRPFITHHLHSVRKNPRRGGGSSMTRPVINYQSSSSRTGPRNSNAWHPHPSELVGAAVWHPHSSEFVGAAAWPRSCRRRRPFLCLSAIPA